MDSQRMLQKMFGEATVGILVVNAEGEIVEANPFCTKLFGYDYDELLGGKVEMLLPDAFRSRHVAHREAYHKKPVPREMGANFELLGQRKNGNQFPVAISLSHFEMEGEQFAIAYVSDDSVKKNMLQELRDRKELLDSAQELAHVGSFEMNIKNGINSWSKEMFRIFGLDHKSDEITYEKYLSHVHPEDRSQIKEFHQKIIQEKKGLEFGYRIMSPTNEIRFVEGKRDVKLDKDGNVIKIFGLLQDVTELKKAQSISLGISKIVEESLNEIFIFDAKDLKFIQVNRGARQNLGYTIEEMQMMTPIDIKPEFDESDFRELVATLQHGEEDKLVFETIHERKDQSTYPVEIHLQLSKIGLQPVFVAIVLDVSQRKKYEKRLLEYSDSLEQKVINRTRELRESEEKLKEALKKEIELGELKSRFVSMASHEFRTPLSSILSSANLIGRYEKEDQQDKRMKHVNRIASSVKNLTNILNDFLSLEKLESGRVRYQPIELDFAEYIEQVIDEMSLMTKNGQKIIYQHEGEEKVFADEHLVKNIIINLLSNGIKYSPSDKDVELYTKYENQHLEIRVKDYGIGIPEADQQHMFTRFFRADNASAIQGTGLGLTIVKRYLDLMNGKIYFESKQGEGTTFFVEIPK